MFELAATRLSVAQPSLTDPTLFAETQVTARRVRRDWFIDFIDFELAGAAFGLARDFIWRGQRQIPVRWIDLGPVSISPGLRYTLSPNGPERQVRTRYKIGAHVGQGYVRWSDALATAQTAPVGAGADYQHPPLHGFVPRVAVDLWRNPDGRIRRSIRGGVQFPPASPAIVSSSRSRSGPKVADTSRATPWRRACT